MKKRPDGETRALVLEAVRDLTIRRRQPPTLKEVGRHLGVSTQTAHLHVRVLARKGLAFNGIGRNAGIRLVEPASCGCLAASAGIGGTV